MKSLINRIAGLERLEQARREAQCPPLTPHQRERAIRIFTRRKDQIMELLGRKPQAGGAQP